jgi:hypothetical protein
MEQTMKASPNSPAVMHMQMNPSSVSTVSNEVTSNLNSNPQTLTAASGSNPLADIDQADLQNIMNILKKYNFKV